LPTPCWAPGAASQARGRRCAKLPEKRGLDPERQHGGDSAGVNCKRPTGELPKDLFVDSWHGPLRGDDASRPIAMSGLDARPSWLTDGEWRLSDDFCSRSREQFVGAASQSIKQQPDPFAHGGVAAPQSFAETRERPRQVLDAARAVVDRISLD